jgi:nitrogen fixation/metabolism regulation signal transduction histidine kinase
VQSLNETVLATAMVGAQNTGNVAYRSVQSGREEIAGFAPVTAHDFVVGVIKSRTDFEAPLQGLYRQLQWSVALVGLLFTGLALRFARSIVRPIRALTQAAGALKEGQYDGTGVEVKRRDELGQLGRTFNVMIDVLRQRERERRREP